MNKKECFVKVQLKNKKETTHNLRFLEAGENNGFYDIRCYDESENEMGFVTFKLNKNEGKIWLYKIETHDDFLHRGVATALINTMEYVAMKNSINCIEGKYYPENDFAKPFYEKYGYYLPNQTKSWDNYDDTWTMSKYLDFKKIRENIEPNISFEKQGAGLEM